MNELDNDSVVIELFDKVIFESIKDFDLFIFFEFIQMENYEKSRRNNNTDRFETKQRCEPDMFDELFEKALQQNRAEGVVKA
mgnify:CR=1 FL=1